jgi:hypothetical protein
MLSVMHELINGLVHIGQGCVFLLLFKAAVHIWSPTLSQLFEGADVHISIMKKGLQLGHVLHQKAAVLANAVATQG